MLAVEPPPKHRIAAASEEMLPLHEGAPLPRREGFSRRVLQQRYREGEDGVEGSEAGGRNALPCHLGLGDTGQGGFSQPNNCLSANSQGLGHHVENVRQVHI
jgi:hypothetical protein